MEIYKIIGTLFIQTIALWAVSFGSGVITPYKRKRAFYMGAILAKRNTTAISVWTDWFPPIEKLRAIQWTPVTGQPKTSTFIKELQKIQKAGKNLILFPRNDEIEFLLDNLSSRGLHMLVYAWSEEEAEYLMKLIQTHSKDRKF